MGGACQGQSLPKKVLLLGLQGTGKTTCLYAWCSYLDTEVVPTESFNVETVHGIKEGHIMLIWDVTDSQRRRQFYHGTDAVVYVVDSSSIPPAARNDLIAINRERDLVNIPLLLVFSKCDLTESSTVEMEKKLAVSGIFQGMRYSSAAVTKTEPSSYYLAFQKLCELLYS